MCVAHIHICFGIPDCIVAVSNFTRQIPSLQLTTSTTTRLNVTSWFPLLSYKTRLVVSLFYAYGLHACCVASSVRRVVWVTTFRWNLIDSWRNVGMKARCTLSCERQTADADALGVWHLSTYMHIWSYIRVLSICLHLRCFWSVVKSVGDIFCKPVVYCHRYHLLLFFLIFRNTYVRTYMPALIVIYKYVDSHCD